MSGGSLPWFAHLLVVLAWHIQALAGPGSGYAWAARGACRVGVRGCAQVAGQHARAARRVRRAAGGRGRSVGTAGERKNQIAREHARAYQRKYAPRYEQLDDRDRPGALLVGAHAPWLPWTARPAQFVPCLPPADFCHQSEIRDARERPSPNVRVKSELCLQGL